MGNKSTLYASYFWGSSTIVVLESITRYSYSDSMLLFFKKSEITHHRCISNFLFCGKYLLGANLMVLVTFIPKSLPWARRPYLLLRLLLNMHSLVSCNEESMFSFDPSLRNTWFADRLGLKMHSATSSSSMELRFECVITCFDGDFFKYSATLASYVGME